MVKKALSRADLHYHGTTPGIFSRGLSERMLRVGERRLATPENYGVMGMDNFGDRRYECLLEALGDSVDDRDFFFYSPPHNMVVIKGEEVPTKEGVHLLGIGLPKGKHVLPGKGGISIEDASKKIRDLGGLVVADHPYSRNGIGLFCREMGWEIPYDLLDGWEIYNAEAEARIPKLLPPHANKDATVEYYGSDARREAAGQSLSPLVSSDGHSLFELGKSHRTVSLPVDYTLLTPETLREGLNDYNPTLSVTGGGTVGAWKHAIEMVPWMFLAPHLKPRFGLAVDDNAQD